MQFHPYKCYIPAHPPPTQPNITFGKGREAAAHIRVPRDIRIAVIDRYNTDRPCTLTYEAAARCLAAAKPLPPPNNTISSILVCLTGRISMDEANNTIKFNAMVVVGPDVSVEASFIMYNARAR